VILKANNPIIALDTLNVEKSTLKITIKQADNAKLLNGIQVELFTKEGLSVETRYTNSLGVTIFENVTQGSYYASASDPAGEFALTTSETILLETISGENVEMSMKRATQGNLIVSVTDKETNVKLTNTTLKLVRKSDNQLLQTYLTKEGENAALSVDEKGPFLLYATHAEYLSEVKEITNVTNQSTISFALEKLTAQNSGRVLVHVVDEEGVPVENAQVVIYDAASKFIAQQYAPKLTNASGDASFVGIQSGNYFARVMKYPAAQSDSANFSSKLNELTTVNTVLKVGTAILRVRVIDEQNQPVPFAKVTFFTEGGSECAQNKCAVDADVLGVASYTFKADRKIYARVTSPGFLNYTTLTYALKPGLPITIPITLPRSISGSTPKIIVKEIVDTTTGTTALQLDKGKSYRWVFQLYIPEEANGLQEAGVHMRVGDDERVESENAYILSTIGAQTSSMSGTTFQSDLGWGEDKKNIVSGGENAKWTQLTWNNPQPGVYEGAVLFHVESSAALLETIPLYYRAWGTLGNTWSRDPYDLELGENEESGGKESLYADVYTKVYTVGKPLACGDAVCYGSELLENLDTGLITKKEPFSTIALNEYRYSFVVSGGSANGLSDARIRVITQGESGSQSGPVINAYTFENVPGNVVSESGISTHNVDGGGNGLGVSVGTISSTQTVLGTIDFAASSDTSSEMVVQIISSGDIIFERTIAFASSGFQNLSISSNPSVARAFVAGTFDIHVTDDQGFDVAGARVRVTKMDSSQNQFVLVEQYTDVFGHTIIQTPASLLGTRFVIEASRGNESAPILTIPVSSNVVEFDPEELSFILDAVPNADAFLPFDVKNVAQEELTLTNTFITGDFQGLLSLDDMQNWLNQYHGNTRLIADTTKTIQMKASAPESLFLLSGKNLSGNLVMLFENASGTSTWVQTIPFTITLAIPTQCDEEGIQVAGFPTNGSTQLTAFENRVEKSFQLVNMCTVNGKAVDLHDLKAKITWRSQVNGNVELSLRSSQNGEEVLEALHNGTYSQLISLFSSAEQTPYEGVLTFTPLPKHVGETADFAITLSASAGQGNETETIIQSFDVKIKITNYESCVKFDVDTQGGLVIESDSTQAQFSIDTSECGDVPVNVSFCTGAGNQNCSGGAPQGNIYLSQYAIQNLKGNKTIRVERKTSTLPGTYDITVDASTPGNNMRRIAALPLRVESKNNYAFSVEKTAYSVVGRDAMDSSEVENRLVADPVRIIKLTGMSISANPIPLDAIDIVLSENIQPYYRANWAIDNPILEKDGDDWIESVGLTFTNTSGHTTGLSEFGVMTLRATEHIHRNRSAYEKTREEKFHIKVSTQDMRPAYYPVTFDGVACESPSGGIGGTGENALPRVNFTWNWNDNTGITWDACDVSNPRAIYCDATQFNIMMQKRLKMLDNFLAANQYNFECPEEMGSQPESEVFTRLGAVPSGFIGYHLYGYTFQGPTVLSFSGTIENATQQNQDATMNVRLIPLSGTAGTALTCETSVSVPANGSIAAQCAISNIAGGRYSLVIDLQSTTTSNIAGVITSNVIDTDSYTQTFGQTCEGLIKTTALIGNKPGINRWIDRNDPQFGQTINDNPIFTAEVPNVDALRKLLHFDAYLMTDGYTHDFENDFRDFYSSNQFADAPAWFKGSGNGVAGMNAYYGDDDTLTFSQKFVNTSTLTQSGKYRVDLDMTFNEEWNMLDASGSPAATLKVVFQHVSPPNPISPFYYLPFNGRIGENGGVFERIGYGLEYVSGENTLLFGENAPLYAGAGSSAMRKVNVQPAATLQQLNSLPSSRGNLLSVDAQTNSSDYAMQFTPTLATPLVMKITQTESEVPFSVFYQIDRANTPVNTGNTFTYWEGAGNCYDYTSVPVWEKFNYSPDRKGVSEDKITNYANVYAIDWPRAMKGGDEYLRTIVYTPANESVNVRAQSANVKFFTANYAAPSTSQLADGVISMSGNNVSNPIHTIHDVFELVKNQHVCVSNSGNQTRFFWNPASVYAQPGQVNVSTFVNGLVAGQTCLGPAN